jgi:hypothetical protein
MPDKHCLQVLLNRLLCMERDDMPESPTVTEQDFGRSHIFVRFGKPLPDKVPLRLFRRLHKARVRSGGKRRRR